MKGKRGLDALTVRGGLVLNYTPPMFRLSPGWGAAWWLNSVGTARAQGNINSDVEPFHMKLPGSNPEPQVNIER